MDRDALIRAAPLMKGEIPHQRHKAKEKVVRSIISLDECPEEIRTATIRRLGNDLGISFNKATISKALGNLLSEGYLEETENNTYTIKEKPETNTLSSLIDSSWREFSEFLENRHDDVDIHFVNKKMESAFKSGLDDIFKRITKYSEEVAEHELEKIETVNLDAIANRLVASQNPLESGRYPSARSRS